MLSKIKRGETQILTINKNDRCLIWVGEYEMEYKGKRYDVASVEEQNGNLILECINDTKEEKLVDGLNTHIKNNVADNSKDKSKSNQAAKKMSVLYSQDVKPVVPQNIFFSQTAILFTKQNIFSAFSPVEVPPPDLV